MKPIPLLNQLTDGRYLELTPHFHKAASDKYDEISKNHRMKVSLVVSW